jgi:hypothetical protein
VANGGFNRRLARFASLYVTLAIILFLPFQLKAQTSSTVTLSPSSLRQTSNYPKPIRWGSVPTETKTELSKKWYDDWSFSLLGSYQFLNQRSRTGDVSLDVETGLIDIAAAYNCPPFTTLDIFYAYSHASGSSPTGVNQTTDQHAGSLRVVQPLLPFLPRDWKPAALSEIPCNHQVAVILSGIYAGAQNDTDLPHFFSVHSSTHTFVGSALLDYQFAYFENRCRTRPKTEKSTDRCFDKSIDLGPDDYAKLFLDFSSGIQFNTTRLDASGRLFGGTSSSRQLTYQNVATLNYSFYHRFGFLVSAEWDAPLYSDPLRNSQPYYANIAIFTGGLTYNYYPGRTRKEFWNHWSMSLLYSYTAFDPFTESNQLQVQASFAF